MRLGGAVVACVAWMGTAVAQTPAPEPPAAAGSELRELIAISREIARTNREGVDYGRVVPDLLTQILAKLDKLEDKLDRIDTKLGERRPTVRR